MSAALQAIRGQSQWSAAFMLMAMSFGYGVLHAAGPGHGKAVVSAWVLANERELKRGILIACMSAVFQALTAIVLVSVLLMTVQAAGTAARGTRRQRWRAPAMRSSRCSASTWLSRRCGRPRQRWPRKRPAPATTIPIPIPIPVHAHAHAHAHDADCACGHSHMPAAKAVAGEWSLTKAISLAFAVGLRPCTGAILVLLLSSAMGLYWAGIASTLAMAVGTALTVSLIAVLAVTSRQLALKLAGRDSVWLSRTVVGLKLAGGLAIAGMGGLLFWASLGPAPASPEDIEMGEYTATLEWQRDGAVFTDNRFSRAHRWRFDGGADVPGSASPLIVPPPLSDPAGVDPEEAFVAAIASCHMLWFLALAARARGSSSTTIATPPSGSWKDRVRQAGDHAGDPAPRHRLFGRQAALARRASVAAPQGARQLLHRQLGARDRAGGLITVGADDPATREFRRQPELTCW
jgi:nickel/cobalt transporter (NicO) family protein